MGDGPKAAARALLKLVRSEDRATASARADEDARRLAETDPTAAYARIIALHREPLLRRAATILSDWEEAIEIVQEVFIKAMREQRFFDADFHRRAWLFRVASNLSINLRRDRQRHIRLQKRASPPLTGLDPIESLIGGRRHEQILDAIEILPDDQREVMLLRYYGDLSYIEISDTLGIKLGTVMSRLSRGRAELVEVLEILGVEDL